MEYTVAESNIYTKFIRLVNELIAQGWKLQGGVCYSSGYYSQAMTREKP
jgi:hypothetical protein